MQRINGTTKRLIFGRAMITTGGEDDAMGAAAPVDEPALNLAELFTPEEIADKQRRASLTDEQRQAEDDAKAAAEAANGAPEEYAGFTAPDVYALDEELTAEFKPLAKELGLSQEKAQKLIDFASQVQHRSMEKIVSAHEERVGNWLKEAQDDPEIGADIKAGKASCAARAFNAITQGDEKAKQMVDELGIGNHPEFLRVFYRIGQRMKEDRFEISGTGGVKEKSPAEAMFPSMRPH